MGSAANVTIPPPPEPASLRPFEDSRDLLDDPIALRARARRDGFLFFRGLLDPEPLLELRRGVLGVLDRHQLREPGVAGLSGKLNLAELHRIPAESMRLDIGVSDQMYVELQQLPALHRLPHHPALLHVYQSLFGSDVFVHPRHIMRAMTPHPAVVATPPHQDFPLVQGSSDTWTCWFPVGECPNPLGPLVVLAGSHHNGYLPIVRGQGAGGLVAQLCEGENDWVGGDFALGDVLTFSCFTVHRSLTPIIDDEIRVSMDVRYQRASEPIEARSLTNHARCTWDEVYEGWGEEDRDLVYYWDADRLTLSPWNGALIESGQRRIC